MWFGKVHISCGLTKLEVGTLILNWSDGRKILCGMYICVRSKINYVNFVSHYVLYLINHSKLSVLIMLFTFFCISATQWLIYTWWCDTKWYYLWTHALSEKSWFPPSEFGSGHIVLFKSDTNVCLTFLWKHWISQPNPSQIKVCGFNWCQAGGVVEGERCILLDLLRGK